jgi:hypothetical protein
VQVPLDPAAHLIAGRHDAAAGGGQVGGEPLDLPLTLGKLGRVALGLLAEPFSCAASTVAETASSTTATSTSSTWARNGSNATDSATGTTRAAPVQAACRIRALVLALLPSFRLAAMRRKARKTPQSKRRFRPVWPPARVQRS